MITKRTGFSRLLFATYYSMKGLKAAFKSEAAVRQELVAMVILVPVAFYLDVTHVERILLVMSLFIVLITELLNTAVEKLCDHVSTDIHVLIGRAKDIGSAAVFVSLTLAIFTWCLILLPRFS
ncbi:diacylglycerol kinase [Alteromonas sp. McT4-15]|jgi:diacylglycerol kinase (ATP)|uniref:diacylglycerol kinase n=1 Tax=unclassified Alteromonas TaxID=2614992 RepID=UPI0019210292|nr:MULTISPECIES: diacylglycerol kinase [unclassified Alteromonas]MCB4438318.1 diacylglycerol kinase [Alteromonas sp. McT4-15]WDT88009.1 diacylglycerol kinase [Alteromonas sp. 009811495]BCO19110.1 diacylglycerol kinase [Alteromonas sp. KC3]BCO23069.1 diacylglycerol kinase [Alteromonas sp. KC14]